MKYASLASSTPGISTTGSSAAGNAASRARGALSSVGRMMRILAEGYVEGRRLQAEVLARRGYPYGCD